MLRLTHPPSVTSIAYADDLALVITERDHQQLQTVALGALQDIEDWMANHGLSLAPHKTEAIALNGHKRPPEIALSFDGHIIPLQPTVRYLGYILDKSLTGTPHIKHAAAKVAKVSADLCRLLPLRGLASDSWRTMLVAVTKNIMLYAASV